MDPISKKHEFLIEVFSTKRKLTKNIVDQLDDATEEELDRAIRKRKKLYRVNIYVTPCLLIPCKGFPNYKKYKVPETRDISVLNSGKILSLVSEKDLKRYLKYVECVMSGIEIELIIL